MPSTIRKSRTPQHGERRLVLRTIVHSDCFGEALKLNHNRPLFDAVLIRFGRDIASEEAPASSEDSRNSELGVTSRVLRRRRLNDSRLPNMP